MEPELQKPSRLYEIDLLRFVAAVLVVIYHYTFVGYNLSHLSPVRYEYLEPITKYFYLGVELFFVISGYVVLMSAYNKTLKQFFYIACSSLISSILGGLYTYFYNSAFIWAK